MTTAHTTQDALAVRIEGLVKRFAEFQLGPLDLNVPAGVVYGLIGPNGAGKTTTIDLIMGMGMPDAGNIRVFGLDHHRDEVEVKRRVGYVSPEMSMAAWVYVGNVLDFISRYYPTWDANYCRQLLHRFALGAGDKIAELSLGNRTRLNLVAALAHRPDLLLLDEPTTGLDPVGKNQFFQEILALMEEDRHTVLISSHNLSDLERFADHIGVIARGRLLLEGSTSELVERFSLVDVRLAGGQRPAAMPGVRVRARDGERWRLLVDGTAPAAQEIERMEVVHRAPLNLEELFVALVSDEVAV